MLLEKKKLSSGELKEVSGGHLPTPQSVNCPQCGTLCQPGINVVVEGEGCDAKSYWFCPNCGHKWK